MTKIVEVLEYLKKYPVFDVTVLNNMLDQDRKYALLFLHRLAKAGRVIRIERNKYTLFNDAFLIASRVVWPSYISCWSALKFHNLTEQIPKDIWVITTKYRKPIQVNNTKIIFIKTKNKNFFGFRKVKYNNFEIFVADPEKSLIDSALLKKVSFSEIKDIIATNFKDLKINNFLNYLKRIGNKSLIKRMGFLFESLGRDYYDKLKKYIDATYIPLDYSKKAIGKKNKKWRLIIND